MYMYMYNVNGDSIVPDKCLHVFVVHIDSSSTAMVMVAVEHDGAMSSFTALV